MIKKEPVNVVKQMIFAVIPILDLYASYKIQKLRWWVLIFWVGGGIIGWFSTETTLSGGMLAESLNNNSDLIYAIDYFVFVIPFAIFQAIVMMIWSKKWNSQMNPGTKV